MWVSLPNWSLQLCSPLIRPALHVVWYHLLTLSVAVSPTFQRTKIQRNSIFHGVKLSGKYLSAKCVLNIDNEKYKVKSLQISHINNENVFVSFSKKV